METKDPAPLAGGDRAGIGYAEQLSLTRKVAATQRLRRQRLVEAIDRLGSARVWFEVIDELDREYELGAELDRRLYAALDPALLAAMGGDRFPASPIRAVSS
jgi:hypothetical protein